MHATNIIDSQDVTEQQVANLKDAARFAKLMNGVLPAKGLTPARELVLSKIDNRTLGFVSNALIYDEGMRDLSKTEHKAALSLVLGGFVRIFKVYGKLPGTYSQSRVGAGESFHYVLKRA